MQENELLKEIVFMIRGSDLPSEEEIKQMTFEEKGKLELEQEQIIQIFRQQALLDIWELKIKISRLLIEAKELREQIMQKKLIPNSLKLIVNTPVKKGNNSNENIEDDQEYNISNKKRNNPANNQNNNSNKKTKKDDIERRKNKDEIENGEIDFKLKKMKIQINSRIRDISEYNEDQNDTEIKYFEEIRNPQEKPKYKIRNLVQRKSKLDSLFLRTSEVVNTKTRRKTNREQATTAQMGQTLQSPPHRTPKYPFNVQPTENMANKKSTNLVSSLNPKVLLDPNNPINISTKDKNSNFNTHLNLNAKNKNDEKLTNSSQKVKNKTKNTTKNDNNNHSKSKTAKDAPEDINIKKSKEMKQRPTPKETYLTEKKVKKETANNKTSNKKVKQISKK